MSEPARNTQPVATTSLGTTITQLDLSAIKLKGRSQVQIKNTSATDTLYVTAQNSGTAPVSLTAANAMRVIAPGGIRILCVDSNIDIYGVMSAAGPTNVRVWQSDAELFEDGYASQTTGGQEIVAPLAQARKTDQTATTDGAQIQPIATSLGKLIVQPFANPENYVRATTPLTTATPAQLQAAPGSGKYIYVTEVTCTCLGATGGATFEVRDGSTNMKTVILQSAGAPVVTITFLTPLRLTANTALNAYCTFGVGSAHMSFAGYIASE